MLIPRVWIAGVVMLAALLAALTSHPNPALGLAVDVRAPRFVADADCVAFIDVEGVLRHPVMKFVMENGDALGFEAGNMAEVKQRFGVDPLTDIRDISISGSGNPEEGRFVIIATTTPAVDNLMAQLTAIRDDEKAEAHAQDIPEVEVTKIDGHTVHVISDDNQKTYLHVREGATQNERLVVVSMDKDWMGRGLNTVDRAAAMGESRRPAAGALVFAAVDNLNWLEIDDGDEPASTIARNAKGLVLNIGETGAETFVDVRVATASNEYARDISDIAQGLLAMGRLAVQHDPEMKPLVAPMRSLSLKADDAAVTLAFKHDTQAIVDLLKNAVDSDKQPSKGDDDGELEISVRLGDGGKGDAKDRNNKDED